MANKVDRVTIDLTNKNDLRNQKAFREWLNKSQKDGFKKYEKYILRKVICEIVKEIAEQENIYRITDPATVVKIKEEYLKRYSEDNNKTSNGGPSAALGKYYEYLKEVQGNTNPTSTGGNNSTSKVHGRNIIFYGAPGTGKSHIVDNIIKGEGEESKKYGLGPGTDFRTTFHPDTDYATFVGCYKPRMINDRIEYRFTMQIFLEAYKYAWEHLGEQVYLVIEEINRGNCAQIFGDIFQLLDREPQTDGHSKYLINPDVDMISELKKQLDNEKYISDLNDVYKKSIEENQIISEKIEKGVLALPGNLTILATMNTSDQSLFPMDSAFKRRWEWEYIIIDYEKIKDWKLYINKQELSWKCVLKHINDYIRERKNATDKQLGEFFLMTKDSANNVIRFEEFRDKVLFYLFNDVFKGDRTFFAADNNRRYFEDIFTGCLSEKDVYNWMVKNLYNESNTDKLSVGDVDVSQETNNVNTEEGQ